VANPAGVTVPLKVADAGPTAEADPVFTLGPVGAVDVVPVVDVLPAFASDNVSWVVVAPADPLPLPVDALPVPVFELPEPVEALPLPVVALPLPVVDEAPEPVDVLSLPVPVDVPPEVELLAGNPSLASRASCACAVARADSSVVSCCSSVVIVCCACWTLMVFASRCAGVSPVCALTSVLSAIARFALAAASVLRALVGSIFASAWPALTCSPAVA
jgi:hypothetical protein